MVNPDGARQQMEGGITMGLGYALTEEVRFQGGRILDRELRHLPDPALLLAAEDRDGPGGEPGPARRRAAASRRSSAWARSSPTRSTTRSGRGCCQLPMTPERVLEALKGASKPYGTIRKGVEAVSWSPQAPERSHQIAFSRAINPARR